MKKKVERSLARKIAWTVLAVIAVLFIILPFFNSLLNGWNLGNVAVISVEGVIIRDGKMFGSDTASSKNIVSFLKDAEEDKMIKAVILEINSPGGSAVASDEIAAQIKKMDKPVVAVIREVGASGGYWVASAADYIIANRMSIVGSIGVISSYLEFSGLMEEYGVSYERLVAGDYKDTGTPFRKLGEEEKKMLQAKIDKIHNFFIHEIAENRDLSTAKVRELATGEFFLGSELLEKGLIDKLGDLDTAEEYLKEEYGLKEVSYVEYREKVSFFEAMAGVFSNYFFRIGEGIGSRLVKSGNQMMLV